MDVSIIGIPETWLKDLNDPVIQLPHYNTEGACRHDKRGDGVAFYINQDWSYMVRNDICVYNSDIEACFIV